MSLRKRRRDSQHKKRTALWVPWKGVQTGRIATMNEPGLGGEGEVGLFEQLTTPQILHFITAGTQA
jgi:hypothetical protein